MKAFLAVTDNDWFRFLRSRPGVDEVNFWQPSGGPTRREPIDPREDPVIGCILLVDPFFFDEKDWIPAPADFSKNIVRGKGYDLTVSPGRELWEAVLARRGAYDSRSPGAVVAPRATGADRQMFGSPVLVKQRLGQGTFRVLVTDIYQRRCAVTGERALPVLQAAHIRPVSQEGLHQTSNGLLLRSDIHTLFDRGYVTVTPDYRFRVSDRLRKDFDNGEDYRRFLGSEIAVPGSAEDRPDPRLLEWHADTVFLG